MRLQAFGKDPNTIQDALEFSSYLLNLGEGKLQSEKKHPVQLPASIKLANDPSDMIEWDFLNPHAMFRNGN